MEHASKGQAALEASDGLAAAGHFTRALIEHPMSPDYFTLRSTALSRLKPPRHDLALRDAEYAVLLGQRRQKREKIQAGQQRRVVTLYGLGRYEESKQVLDSMLKWRGKDVKKDKMEHDMWMAKITSKLKGKDVEGQPAQPFKEYPEIELPDDKKMVEWLKGQLKNDGTFKFDGEADLTTAPNADKGKQTSKVTDTADEEELRAAKAEALAEQQAKPKVQSIRQDWYQDNNSVTITLYAKKVDPTKLKFNFTDDSIHLSFPHPDAADEPFTLTLDPTCNSIDPAASIAKATGAKVEVKLVKKDKGVKWSALDDKSRPKTDKLPSAWTTKGDQDWDKKAADLTKKESKKKKVQKEGEEDSESDPISDADSDMGGDQVDGFFKKLYAGADDDTRRAMMKSFQESNGTALSTNWSEVSKGKVEEVKSKDD